MAERLCSYFKSLGADFVFDLKLCEDLSLVKQIQEFVENKKSGGKTKTILTSACPGSMFVLIVLALLLV